MSTPYFPAEFSSTDGSFNVVVTRKVQRPNGPDIHSEVITIDLPWRMACRCVGGLLTSIGVPDHFRSFEGLIDAHIEPAYKSHPYTNEAMEALRREMIRAQDEEIDGIRWENERAREDLKGSFGTTHIGPAC